MASSMREHCTSFWSCSCTRRVSARRRNRECRVQSGKRPGPEAAAFRASITVSRMRERSFTRSCRRRAKTLIKASATRVSMSLSARRGRQNRSNSSCERNEKHGRLKKNGNARMPSTMRTEQGRYWPREVEGRRIVVAVHGELVDNNRDRLANEVLRGKNPNECLL